MPVGTVPAPRPSVPDLRAESWSHLNDLLYADAYKPRLGRHRSPYVFRGVAVAAYVPRTTLYRLGGDLPVIEQHLLRDFRKYAYGAVSPDTVWEWLALAQHHGLPTRLLDWSYSPLVALHFATMSPSAAHEDGAVWCIDYARANQHLPARLREVLDEEGVQVFTPEMLNRAAATIRDLDGLEPEPAVLFLEPPSLDARIVNQFGLFSLLTSPNVQLHEWLADKPHLLRRVVVPAEIKGEVRDKLDQANVTERVLLPGLDGLSQWLRRYYTPSPAVTEGQQQQHWHAQCDDLPAKEDVNAWHNKPPSNSAA